MYVKKELKVIIDIKDLNFTGVIEAMSSDKNPYIQLAKKLAKENNIPENYIKDTKVMAKGKKISFTFRWSVEEESPEDKKIEILAYIGELPSNKNRNNTIEAFVKINGTIYKTYIYGLDELKNDYNLTNATLLIEENKMNFINSLDIDWNKRYFDSLKKLFFDYDLNTGKIKDFLKLDYVKEFIIAEDGESLSDTAPREILLDWYEEILFDGGDDSFADFLGDDYD